MYTYFRIQPKITRRVCKVILPDGRDLGEEEVKADLAWWVKKHAFDYKVLAQLHAQARAARRGLWHDPKPIPQ